jgi:DNA-binding CsgD family transcriptional regulator
VLPHIKLFLVLVALILSAWGVLRLRQIGTRFSHLGVDALVRYTVIFSAALLAAFLFAYADLNLGRLVVRPSAGRSLDAVNWLLSWLVPALLYFMLTVVLGLLDRRPPVGVRRAGLTVLAVIGAGYLTRIVWPGAGVWLGWLDWIRRWVIENILLLEIPFLVYLLLKGRQLTDPIRRRMVTVFAALYLGRYVVAIVLLVVASLVPIGEWTRLPLSMALVLGFAYLPVFWAERYFVPYAERVPRLPEDEAWWESLVAEYKLSKRELEVLRLVLTGKTNRDIEALLGVSVHTVKNHVYNIFNKVGVDSRYQLVHLLLNRRR